MPTTDKKHPELIVGENTYVVDNTDPTINDADLARLINQDETMNEDGGVPLLPAGYQPDADHAILDVACGPAGWLRTIHSEYPDAYLVGIDNNKKAISFARNNEETRHKENVNFVLMNIMEPLDFPNHTFDFVNARFLTGVVPTDRWVDLLTECYRILKPGGYIRITESETSWVANCPAYERMIDLFLRFLYEVQRSFARNGLAISPMLLEFFGASGFHEIMAQTSTLNWSYGQTLHDQVVEDMTMSLAVLRNAFFKAGYISPDDYEHTYQLMLTELSSKDFRALWPLVSVQGRKPA